MVVGAKPGVVPLCGLCCKLSGSCSTGTVALRHNVPVNDFLIQDFIIAMISLFLGCICRVPFALALEYNVAGTRSSSKHTTTESGHITT